MIALKLYSFIFEINKIRYIAHVEKLPAAGSPTTTLFRLHPSHTDYTNLFILKLFYHVNDIFIK